jgi:hypothetical protein
MMPCGIGMLRWPPVVVPFGTSLVDVDHSQVVMWQIWWYGLWYGPMGCCHVSLGDLTGWESVLPCGKGWVRWTNELLTRGTSGTHLSDMWDPHGWGGPMRCWHVALTWWGDPMRCWHVAPSLSSLILCVYVWDPQFAPRWVFVPKLHPDESLSPSCTQMNPWLNLSLWSPFLICLIFSEFILIVSLFQKSWNFHQKSLNSWWSSL